MNERLQAILDTYLSQVGDSIRYITYIEYDCTAEVFLKIRYVDNGGNFHSLGWNERGMLTFD